MAKRAFKITSARPVPPTNISNKAKPPKSAIGPITVHVGGRVSQSKATAEKAGGTQRASMSVPTPALAPEVVDPIEAAKKRAAESLRKKAAETTQATREREEATARDVEQARLEREAAKAKRVSRRSGDPEAGHKRGKDAATVKAEAKARAAARAAAEKSPASPAQETISASAAAGKISPMPAKPDAKTKGKKRKKAASGDPATRDAEAKLAVMARDQERQQAIVDAARQAAKPHVDESPAPVASPPEKITAPTSQIAQQQPEPQSTRIAPNSAPNPAVELVVALAALKGLTVSRADIDEGFSGEAAPSVDAYVRALAATGLKARLSAQSDPRARHWPAIAVMTTGQLVLVKAEKDGVLSVVDATAPDGELEVPKSEFAPFFTGQLIQAQRSLDSIARAYVPDTAKQHWFWGQFLSYRKQIGEIALGSLVANMLAVAVALFSLQVYDRVIPHQSLATLWVLALGAGLAIVLEAGLKLARARLMDGSGRQIELKVQSLLMDRVLGMRSDARPQSSAGLFSAMREFGSVREFFTSSTIGTLADIPFIFLFFALVASIAGPVVFLLMAGAVLMVIPGFLLQKRMMRLTKETQGAAMQSSRLLHEAIAELDTIKSHRGETRMRRIWDELNTLSAVKSSEQRKLASLLTFWSQGVQQLTYVAAVVAGAYLVFAGDFTVGTIIATGILTSRTLAPLAQLSGTLARWTNVKAALDGLDGIVDAPQDADPTRSYLRRDVLSGDYAIREMQFRYHAEGAPNLDIPALDIKPGQKIALLGANGSGKSTFLKLLAGLYAPSQGRLILDGAEMHQLDARDLRRNVGYLGQDVRLFAGSLRDNLNLGGQETDDLRLFAALDFAGLGTFVRSHHRGLDLEIKDGGEGLSVGQRQSIGWARLWLQDPRVCLLDEPTAALDTALEAKLIGRVHDWLASRTAVIATHRMPIVELADRTMVFKDGRLVVDGPRAQVTAHLAKAASASQVAQ